MKGATIWILGEPDNNLTKHFVQYLGNRFPSRSVSILVSKSSIKRDLVRFKRKVLNAGLFAALDRVVTVLRNRYSTVPSFFRFCKLNGLKSVPPPCSINFVYVDSLHSKKCIDLIRENDIKYFLTATDSIIPTSLIRATPLGIWNAHPGAVPRYRGLGASDRMLADGYFPLVTLHLIDEGIDTGPALFEVRPDFSSCANVEDVYRSIEEAQFEALGSLVEIMDENKRINFRDDFFVPSSISHRNDRETQRIVSLISDVRLLKEYNGKVSHNRDR